MFQELKGFSPTGNEGGGQGPGGAGHAGKGPSRRGKVTLQRELAPLRSSVREHGFCSASPTQPVLQATAVPGRGTWAWGPNPEGSATPRGADGCRVFTALTDCGVFPKRRRQEDAHLAQFSYAHGDVTTAKGHVGRY